ncbi:VanZ family protein [Spirosoma aerophilum]
MKISHTLIRWGAIGWTVIMLIGCLTPHSELPDELVAWNDKGQHIGIFALFAVLWRLDGIRPLQVGLIGVLFGGLIELLQYVLPINRSGDWVDLAADSLGVGIGILLAIGVQRIVVRSVG